MTKMVGARPLHELYGTTNRRRHFPDVGWHHLVLAARNTAAAFHTLHSANIVVGDVNQGNLLVDKQMCVRMIDCDSFQITNGETTFQLPRRHAALHAAGAAVAEAARRDPHRQPRSLRPGDSDLSLAVRRPASVRRSLSRRGRPVDRKGDRRTPLCIFEEPSGDARRSAAGVAAARRFAAEHRQTCSKRHSAATEATDRPPEPARLGASSSTR